MEKAKDLEAVLNPLIEEVEKLNQRTDLTKKQLYYFSRIKARLMQYENDYFKLTGSFYYP